MAKDIVVAQSIYNVQSGKSALIQAAVVEAGVVNNREKLLFAVSEGDIDPKGLFKAPETSTDIAVVVTIKIASTGDIETVVVNVAGKTSAKERPLLQLAEVVEIGGEGKYVLHVQAIADNKHGHKCQVVVSDKSVGCARKIIPESIGSNKYLSEQTFDTDDDGFLSLPLRSFTERRRYLVVRIKGTKKDETVKLFGPTAPSKIKPNAGFWANLMKK